MNKELSALLCEVDKLKALYELSKTAAPDHYEPGMMEYLDQSYGSFDEASGELLLRFEARGTRYEGRTEQIEKMKVGDPVQVVRESDNPYNHNNFYLATAKGKNIGNVPAELCNAMAPLYDAGQLQIQSARVSFVEPISQRSRHAKQAVLFAEFRADVISQRTL